MTFDELLLAQDPLATEVRDCAQQSGLTSTPAALRAIVVELVATRAALERLKFDLIDWEIDIYG